MLSKTMIAHNQKISWKTKLRSLALALRSADSLRTLMRGPRASATPIRRITPKLTATRGQKLEVKIRPRHEKKGCMLNAADMNRGNKEEKRGVRVDIGTKTAHL